jgi:hypothetical protein
MEILKGYSMRIPIYPQVPYRAQGAQGAQYPELLECHDLFSGSGCSSPLGV